MSGLLKVLAAGAAKGARDVSNRNVEIENQDRLYQMLGQRDANREALRHHYETERYKQVRTDRKEDLQQAMKAEEAGLLRKRKFDLEDQEADRKFKSEQKDKDRANARSVAAIKQSQSSEKPHSRQKLAEYYVRTGRVKNLDEAEALIQEIELVKGAASSGLFDVEDYLNKKKSPKMGGDTYLNFDPERGFIQ